MDEEPEKSLWVTIREREGESDVIVSVCYRPPEQDEQADETLHRQTGTISHLQALVFMEI